MKSLSFALSLILVFVVVMTSCSSVSETECYNIINCTSSDISFLAKSLGGEYVLSKAYEDISLTGKNVLVSLSENGYPFDLSEFNDSGYVIRAIEDDIIICAKNESALTEAVDYFSNQYVSGGELLFAKDLNYVYGCADRLGKVLVNGNDLSKYKIVIPEMATEFEDYAASIFADFLYDAGGITLEVCNDSVAEGEFEIVIGNTNRPETPKNREYGALEYYLGLIGNDIVIDGDSYMVGGGIGKLISEYLSPEDCGDVALDSVGNGAIYTYTPSKARSAILVIGDGMGYNHIALAQDKNYIQDFYGYYLPHQGRSVTYSYDGTTDSAASATAMACGFKTTNGFVGMDRQGNVMLNVRELADSVGARTSVITTDSLLGATPSGFLSHSLSRSDNEAISSWYPKINCEYVRGDLSWDLLDETINAISHIGESGDPFFIMIEEAYTDKGGHSNDAYTIAEAVERLNYSIAYAMEYCVCHTDTVLIITADHETGGIIERKGKLHFTSYSHTNVDVPLLAIGDGTEVFHDKANENVTIASFIAKIFGDDNFGHLS